MAKILVTGSSGHLGEALMRTLQAKGTEVVGIDLLASPFTHFRGSVTDRELILRSLHNVKTVFHCATLHKPHVATHSKQAFIDTNITGTLNLLEESLAAGVQQFIYTSTTSVFGDALVPPAGAPAAWIDETVTPVPKNIYGVTKFAAENLCQLFFRNHKLPCIVLRTSRFFPEDDDDRGKREAFPGDNLKVNELLFRRLDVSDAVGAHLAAAEKAVAIGFGTYIVSATTPFCRQDCVMLRHDAPGVVARLFPSYKQEFFRRSWKMLPELDRVYDNAKARNELGWNPFYNFRSALDLLSRDDDFRSPLTHAIGSKGYHSEVFEDGPFPVH